MTDLRSYLSAYHQYEHPDPRPAVFGHPDDVLKDRRLTAQEKRECWHPGHRIYTPFLMFPRCASFPTARSSKSTTSLTL